MCACTDIFARPSIAQRAQKVRGRSDQRRSQRRRLLRILYHEAKHACLQGHFCEAVNFAPVRITGGKAAKSCFARLSANIIT